MRCQGCGAEIRWYKTINGSEIQLDCKPERRAIVVPAESNNSYPTVAIVDTFTPHAVTCTFRRDK